MEEEMEPALQAADKTQAEEQTFAPASELVQAAEMLGIEMTEEEKEIEALRNGPKAKWYVIHTYVGYEQVAKENLEKMVEKFDLKKRIFDIVIPTETVVEEKNGKKKLVERKLTPNYIYAKIDYADDIWHNITRTRGVTGFTGPRGRPLALTEEEVSKMKLGRKVSLITAYGIADRIEVIDGPLAGVFGKITAVDNDNKRLKVTVEMFGRDTAVELEFSQAKKID